MTREEADTLVLKEIDIESTLDFASWEDLKNYRERLVAFRKSAYESTGDCAAIVFLDIYLSPPELHNASEDVEISYMLIVEDWLNDLVTMRTESMNAAIFEKINQDRANWKPLMKLIFNMGYPHGEQWLDSILSRAKRTSSNLDEEEAILMEQARKEIERGKTINASIAANEEQSTP